MVLMLSKIISFMRHTILFPILLAICLSGVGCGKTETPAAECEEMTVSLKLDGDFDAFVDQEPMTKAGSSNDAYGINVYYDKEGDGATNDLYAYGLFDNVADMTITLLTKHKYKVQCTLVKNARNTLYFGQAFGNAYSGYAYPFQTNSSNSTQVTNKFVIGTSNYFSGFGSGDAHVASTTSPSTSNSTKCASANRFYGETDQYEPVAGGKIDVYLKRVIFGAKFVVTGLKEGTLDVKCGDFFLKTYSTDDGGVEKIYTFPDVYNVWKNDTPLTENVTISYTSARGKLWNISQEQKVQFKRNVMTTVNIQVNPDLSGANFNVTKEELEEDNVIDMGINTDGLIDIIVNPED